MSNSAHIPVIYNIKCNPNMKNVVSFRVSQLKYLPSSGSMLNAS